MCGSTGLEKKNGEYVCQYCGAKYAPDEAEKASDGLENLITLARRAKAENNAENGEKFYDMMLLKSPNNWEACFYSAYYKAVNSKLADCEKAVDSVTAATGTALGLIAKYVPEDEREDAVKEIIRSSGKIAEILARGYKSLSFNDGYKYGSMGSETVNIAYLCGDLTDELFGYNRDISSLAVDAWENGMRIQRDIMRSADNVFFENAEKIRKYDPALADRYIKEEKTKLLKDDIEKLRREISYREKGPERNRAFISMFCLAALFIGIGFICLFAGKEPLGMAVFGAMGAVFIALGIVFLVPKKSVKEEYKAKLEYAKEQLKEKEEELADVSKL